MSFLMKFVRNPNIRSYTHKNAGQKPVSSSNFRALSSYQGAVFFISAGSIISKEAKS